MDSKDDAVVRTTGRDALPSIQETSDRNSRRATRRANRMRALMEGDELENDRLTPVGTRRAARGIRNEAESNHTNASMTEQTSSPANEPIQTSRRERHQRRRIRHNQAEDNEMQQVPVTNENETETNDERTIPENYLRRNRRLRNMSDIDNKEEETPQSLPEPHEVSEVGQIGRSSRRLRSAQRERRRQQQEAKPQDDGVEDQPKPQTDQPQTGLGQDVDEENLVERLISSMPLPPSALDRAFGSGYLPIEPPQLPALQLNLKYDDFNDESDIQKYYRDLMTRYGSTACLRAYRAGIERQHRGLQHSTLSSCTLACVRWSRRLLVGPGVDEFTPLPKGVYIQRLLMLFLGLAVIFVVCSAQALCLFGNFCFQRGAATVSPLASTTVFPVVAVFLLILFPLNAINAYTHHAIFALFTSITNIIATILLFVASIASLTNTAPDIVRELTEKTWRKFGTVERGFYHDNISELEDSVLNDMALLGGLALVVAILMLLIALASCLFFWILKASFGREESLCGGIFGRGSGMTISGNLFGLTSTQKNQTQEKESSTINQPMNNT